MKCFIEICLLVYIYCTLVTAKACTSGWFGSECQFKCHCSANGVCDAHGRCPTKCDKGWFGLSCQYQDLAATATTITITPRHATFTWLRDNDESTCNEDKNLASIHLTWNTPFPFTWLRLKFNSQGLTGLFTITFKTIHSFTMSCNNEYYSTADNTTVDYKCDINEEINDLTLTGPGLKSICSFYISGGICVMLNV
uniref:EGF-like domain-containing protein n=1 Tax=Biomphalaria glabrata TaxID=6526 RepID=A0A2C9K0C3_BIOGL